MNFSLVFNDISPWWIVPCVALGLLYAWFLYRRNFPSNNTIRRLLFGFRTFTVALLAFLLLSPLLKRISRTIEKIGRAPCRERVCPYVSISVVAVSLKKKKEKSTRVKKEL